MTAASTRRQMNVRLPPAAIAHADQRRAALGGLSRDRFIEQLLDDDRARCEAETPDPTPEELAEAEELAARIRGTD